MAMNTHWDGRNRRHVWCEVRMLFSHYGAALVRLLRGVGILAAVDLDNILVLCRGCCSLSVFYLLFPND